RAALGRSARSRLHGLLVIGLLQRTRHLVVELALRQLGGSHRLRLNISSSLLSIVCNLRLRLPVHLLAQALLRRRGDRASRGGRRPSTGRTCTAVLARRLLELAGIFIVLGVITGLIQARLHLGQVLISPACASLGQTLRPLLAVGVQEGGVR